VGPTTFEPKRREIIKQYRPDGACGNPVQIGMDRTLRLPYKTL
jgi:hypothetical protein